MTKRMIYSKFKTNVRNHTDGSAIIEDNRTLSYTQLDEMADYIFLEPEEVENVLNTCPYVERGIVRAFHDEAGLHYLIPKEGCKLHNTKAWLASQLNDFMIFEFFVKIKEIPIPQRGKVKIEALPVVMKEGGV